MVCMFLHWKYVCTNLVGVRDHLGLLVLVFARVHIEVMWMCFWRFSYCCKIGVVVCVAMVSWWILFGMDVKR